MSDDAKCPAATVPWCKCGGYPLAGYRARFVADICHTAEKCELWSPAPPAEAAPTRELTEGHNMTSEEVPPASTNDAAGLGSHGGGNRTSVRVRVNEIVRARLTIIAGELELLDATMRESLTPTMAAWLDHLRKQVWMCINFGPEKATELTTFALATLDPTSNTVQPPTSPEGER